MGTYYVAGTVLGRYIRFKSKQDVHWPHRKSNQEGMTKLRIRKRHAKMEKEWCTTNVCSTHGGAM